MVSFFLYLLLALIAPTEVDTTACYQVPDKYDGPCHFNDKEPAPVFPFGNIEFDWKMTE